jgi:hypothetical protein
MYNPKAPRSPTLSQKERFSWVLGEPLIVPPKRKWSQRDILRHWIHISDTKNGSRADIIGLVVKSLISYWKIYGFGTEIKSEVSLCLKLSKILANKVEKKLKSSEHSNRLFDTEWISQKQAEFSQPFDLAKGPATPVKESLQKVSQLMFLKLYIRFLFTKISITNFRNIIINRIGIFLKYSEND